MITSVFNFFKFYISQIPEVKTIELFSNFSFDESKNNRYVYPAVLVEFTPVDIHFELDGSDSCNCIINIHLIQHVTDDTILVDKLSSKLRGKHSETENIKICKVVRSRMNYTNKIINNVYRESIITYKFRLYDYTAVETEFETFTVTDIDDFNIKKYIY